MDLENSETGRSEGWIFHRKEHGKLGDVIKLKTNHFVVNFNKDLNIHQYKMNIKPNISIVEIRKRIFFRVEEIHKEIFKSAFCIFDGENSIFTNSVLQMKDTNGNFKVHLEDEKDIKYNVTIEKINEFNLHIIQHNSENNTKQINYLIFQLFNIIFEYLLCNRYTNEGQISFIHNEKITKLSYGAEIWRGLRRRMKVGSLEDLLINIDTTTEVFFTAQSMLNFVRDICGFKTAISSEFILKTEKEEILNRDVKGLKVETIYPLDRTTHKICSISTLSKQKTDSRDTKEKTGDSKRKYSKLKYPKLPYLQTSDNHFIPIEMCCIPKGQHYRKLTPLQMLQYTNASIISDNEREKKIKAMIDIGGKAEERNLMKAYGITIKSNLIQLSGRQLPHLPVEVKESLISRDEGGRSQEMDCYLILKAWIILTFESDENYNTKKIENWITKFQEAGAKLGYEIHPPVIWKYCQSIEDALSMIEVVQEYKENLQLVLINFPNEKDVRKDKIINEFTSIPIESFHLNDRKGFQQLFQNICLRLGGKNYSLEIKRPSIGSIFINPVLVLGIAVDHPSAKDMHSPSIAVVTGSLDLFASRYKPKIRIQENKMQKIVDIKNLIKDLLKDFRESADIHVPKKIIIFRYGLNEAEYADIFNDEIQLIEKTCFEFKKKWKPEITFITVDRNHLTRFFSDFKLNAIPSGTVVDRKIIHPIFNDFYLSSHQGIHGTSRPTHYTVLKDDSNFSADELQQITYELCFAYENCAFPLTLPSPVFYAQLAACSARYHLQTLKKQYSRNSKSNLQKEIDDHYILKNIQF